MEGNKNDRVGPCKGTSKELKTLLALLRDCTRRKDLQSGIKMHTDIEERGLLATSSEVVTAVIGMYANCGALGKAKEFLDALPSRETSAWNALIAGYTQQDEGQEALNSFEHMQHEGFSPNTDTLACILKACGILGAMDKGEQIHANICRQGTVESDALLGNALVAMYAKCGALRKATRLLEDLCTCTVASYNALITAYVHHGESQHALKCYDWMQRDGLSPDTVTFTCMLRVCSAIGAIDKGEQIHDQITTQGLLEKNIALANALVDMYVKCGDMKKARQVLNEIPARNVVTWSALIAGHAQQGHGEDALKCFDLMREDGVSPNAVTFACILKACSSMGMVDKGEQIHGEILRQEWLENNGVLSCSLVDMYVKCGALARAQQVLQDLPAWDIVPWNAVIAGYVQQGRGVDALSSYDRMQVKGLTPNGVTFACILKACGTIGAINKGEQVYDEIARRGLLGKDIVLDTAVVDMYAKCGALSTAARVMEELSMVDVVAWNALIAGYAQNWQSEDALSCYEEMRHRGLSPTSVTFTCSLKACGCVGAIDKGQDIHCEVIRKSMLENNVELCNALVDMYTKCGALALARELVEELPTADIVAWNTLVAGYAQQGNYEDALDCFERVQLKGLTPDMVTFSCILKAYGSIGAADGGEQVHDEIAKEGGFAKENNALGNALVDMYVKCGALVKARQVLEELCSPNVATWTALIGGYAQQGQSWDALRCFQEMQDKGVSPDGGTFSCMLNACTHSGLLDEGQMYLTSMSTEYDITPDAEHYTCMVDLFGRAGKLDKAVEIIQRMPCHDNCVVWSMLLGSCQQRADTHVGRWAFEHAIQGDDGDMPAYVIMANIYATTGCCQLISKERWPGYTRWSYAKSKLWKGSQGVSKQHGSQTRPPIASNPL